MNSAGWTRPSATRLRLNRLHSLAEATLPVFLSLFAVSVLLNVLVGVFHGYRPDYQALDWDEREYYGLSSQILAGDWDLGERRTLLYPLILAGLRTINGNFLFLQIAVSIIAAFAAPLLYCVVRRLSGSALLGLIAGVLMLVWPTQLFLATSLYSETVALPFFLLFPLALPPGSRAIGVDGRPTADPSPAKWPRGAILAGLALGVTAHIRPMYLLFLPFALIIPFLEEQSLRRAARTAVLVALSFALVVLPWSVWMTTRYGQPIILTANGGETLAGGLNPHLVTMQTYKLGLANRTTWVGPGKWLTPDQTGYLSPAETQLPYGQVARLLQQRSSAWIAAHPGAVLRIELCKLGYMWGMWPWSFDSPVKLLAGNLPILVLVGMFVGLWAWKPNYWLGLARLWTVPLFVSAVALISWGSWRFRQPADAALLAFCVIAMGVAPRRGQVADAR